MSNIQATNDFVFIVRDITPTETLGLLLPTLGKEKPSTGTVFSIGSLAQDKEIKRSKGKKALFHKGIGAEIEYENETYLVLRESEIIAVV